MGENAAPPQKNPQILEGWIVLIVDDEPDNLDVVFRLLRRSGAIVHGAENGRQALKVLQTIRPNFIITDLAMPEMDGWTLLKEIKKDPLNSQIPVIALTALAMWEDRERAGSVGFASYITKPLDTFKFTANLVAILTEMGLIT